jgi:hypothetical protein
MNVEKLLIVGLQKAMRPTMRWYTHPDRIRTAGGATFRSAYRRLELRRDALRSARTAPVWWYWIIFRIGSFLLRIDDTLTANLLLHMIPNDLRHRIF